MAPSSTSDSSSGRNLAVELLLDADSYGSVYRAGRILVSQLMSLDRGDLCSETAPTHLEC